MSWFKDRWHGFLDNAIYDWGWRVIVWGSPFLLSAGYWLLAWLGKVTWSALLNAVLLIIAIVLFVIGIWRTGTPKKRKFHEAGGLIGRIPHVVFFDGSNERDGVVVALEIINRGDPTIVDRWGLIIELDGRKSQYRATHFHKDFTVWDNQGYPVKLEASQMLYERVGNTPIPKGGRQIGYLIFLTKDISFERLKTARPRLRVVFSDAFDNEYSTESSSESTGTILHQPGLDDPFGQILIREAALTKSVQALPLREIRGALDVLITKGQSLVEEWMKRLDYLGKQQRENNSSNWLWEANEFAKKHLAIEQINEFTSRHSMATSGSKKYDFAMALTHAGTQPSSEDGNLAFEIFGKVKLLERFRSEPTPPS